ncbi:hypothetical protein GCM10023209_32180 [Roseibacterium beibuensis]|uniref:Uncharacterized protein n=1 Tax=[Roseibacterium] beibuensis TaxID=1193142 RepID=A0ABP9LMQ6_9RHOB
MDRSDIVLATSIASTCIAALCSFVVLSNVSDARIGSRSATATEELAAMRPAPRPTEARQYPQAEASGALTLGEFEDELAAVRQAPLLTPMRAPRLALATPQGSAPDAVEPVSVPVMLGRPPVEAVPRPQIGVEVVQVARNLTTARALALPTPSVRPEAIIARAVPIVPETPGAEGAPEAAPSVLLAAVSPRPALRPEGLADRFPVRATPGRADPGIQVARAVEPEEEITLARYEDPGRPSLLGPRAGSNPCSSRLADIPRRRGSAPSGSAVMASLGNGSGSGRDNAIVAQALSGNVPDFLRDLQPVSFTGIAGGRQTEITICVTPDYLAIGSDADHVRVPLGLPAALRVADGFDMMLPTTRMVDAIYAQADLRLSPSPMTPGPQMSSTDYFLRHDATVDAQFARAGGRGGILVAGHKKDVVIANRLSRAPGRVAIYGWHRSNGNPIQPLSTVHGEYYADYSHGIRLVSRTAYVNGRAIDLRSLLTDGQYASLLNDDGPLNSTTVRLAALQ